MEVIGIGLIVPYVALIATPDDSTYNYLFTIVQKIGISIEGNELISLLGLILIAVFFIKAIVVVFINKIIFKFCLNKGVDLRSTLMRNYQNLPYGEYLKRNSSEYIYSMQTLVLNYSLDVLQALLRMFSEGIVIFAIFFALALINFYAFLMLFILMGAIVLFYDWITKDKMFKYGELTNKYSSKMIQGINEGISGLKEMRILGKESYFHNIVVNNARKHATASVKSAVIRTIPRFFTEFGLILFIVTLVYSFIYFDKGLTSIVPTLSVFGIASLRLLPSINQISNNFTSFRFGRDSVHLLYQDINEISQDKLKDLDNDTSNSDSFISMKLIDVKFTYSDRSIPALNKVSLSIESGDSIGIIGPSGSGKTTIVDVMLGLLDPQEGVILFNDRPINEKLTNFTSQVAYMPQQVFLIDDSLEKNIALNEDNIDYVKLEKSIEKAKLTNMVKQLPNGTKTVLGESGIRLSGGQRQRISLARAFYHERNILVMDESTSALDNETEREVMEEIKNLKGKVTMIIIAHRLSTVQHCDYIYRFDKGRIVQEGSFSEVVK